MRRSSGYLFGTVVTVKGPGRDCAVAAAASWLQELGHARFILQSDGEPALKAFRTATKAKFLQNCGPGAVESVEERNSPVCSHESNGGAERAVQTIRGLAQRLGSRFRGHGDFAHRDTASSAA